MIFVCTCFNSCFFVLLMQKVSYPTLSLYYVLHILIDKNLHPISFCHPWVYHELEQRVTDSNMIVPSNQYDTYCACIRQFLDQTPYDLHEWTAKEECWITQFRAIINNIEIQSIKTCCQDALDTISASLNSLSQNQFQTLCLKIFKHS